MRAASDLIITVSTYDLLQIVTENREKHEHDFNVAIEKYRKIVVEYLNARINDVKAGQVIEHHIRVPQPEQHLDDYDQVIRMLKMHKDDTIAIPYETYRMYVDDVWDWSRAFTMNTGSYLG